MDNYQLHQKVVKRLKDEHNLIVKQFFIRTFTNSWRRNFLRQLIKRRKLFINNLFSIYLTYGRQIDKPHQLRKRVKGDKGM